LLPSKASWAYTGKAIKLINTINTNVIVFTGNPPF
jgi:hypothetical protein